MLNNFIIILIVLLLGVFLAQGQTNRLQDLEKAYETYHREISALRVLPEKREEFWIQQYNEPLPARIRRESGSDNEENKRSASEAHRLNELRKVSQAMLNRYVVSELIENDELSINKIKHKRAKPHKGSPIDPVIYLDLSEAFKVNKDNKKAECSNLYLWQKRYQRLAEIIKNNEPLESEAYQIISSAIKNELKKSCQEHVNLYRLLELLKIDGLESYFKPPVPIPMIMEDR